SDRRRGGAAPRRCRERDGHAPRRGTRRARAQARGALQHARQLSTTATGRVRAPRAYHRKTTAVRQHRAQLRRGASAPEGRYQGWAQAMTGFGSVPDELRATAGQIAETVEQVAGVMWRGPGGDYGHEGVAQAWGRFMEDVGAQVRGL